MITEKSGKFGKECGLLSVVALQYANVEREDT